MYCYNCGEKNPEEAKFCKNCGATLKKEETIKKVEVIQTPAGNQNTSYQNTQTHTTTSTTSNSSKDSSDWIGCCICLIVIFIIFGIASFH